ncbi:MAG TPA: acyl-CoA dehydrogenase family protein, partial [Mycobacteriales bacterium]|nr:acyl-CoA dehydrogenase family protein [Mycobacteriales bacterium]
ATAVEVLPAVATGATAAALVVGPGVVSDGDRLTGSADHVVDGGPADLLVVANESRLWLLDATATGVEVRPAATLDRTRSYATVRLEGATARPVGDPAAAAAAVDLLRVGLAVEAVGLARRCLELTVEHLKTRVQFGKPIGSFQALQHRCADLAVSLEAATSTAYYAAWAAADSPAELPVVAPLAKSVCTDAAYAVAAETIQLHGGVGFTWEHDAHLYFKRATVLRSLLGDSHAQRQLVATRSGVLAGSR